jgi:hypothetical protein
VSALEVSGRDPVTKEPRWALLGAGLLSDSQGISAPGGGGGTPGPEGPQGPEGPAGPAGAAGAAGAQGPVGPEGPQGPAGAAGQEGDAGPQGVPGADGAAGAQGPPGADGDDGAAGAQGPQGPQGIQGPAGADGAAGAQGIQGPQGDAGAQGIQGIQGIQGVQGPAGTPGGEASWPVGSLFLATVATNPATLLGFGTWAAFGAGRVLVGLDAGQSEFDTVLETGGAKTHTLTTAEIPAHTHTQSLPTSQTGSQVSGTRDASTTGTGADALATGSAGGGGAHNNLPPYVVVYMWHRTL